ncbi:MAG: RNA polymerase sigma factor [Sumerlaeia bacterium]
MSVLDDAELVQRTRRGDRRAMEKLIELHYAGVLAEGRKILKDEDAAENLAQEVFLRAALNLETLREDQKFGGWVRTIARNLARTWKRSETRTSRLARQILLEDSAMENIADTTPSAPERLEEVDRLSQLRQALEGLEPDERDVILRHFFQNESQRDIGRELGVHHTTISRRIQGALGKLKTFLTPGEPAFSGPQKAKVLCAAALALPAAKKSAVAGEIARETATLSLPPWMSAIHPHFAATAAGVIAMNTTQKIVVAAIAAALLVGGTVATKATTGSPGSALFASAAAPSETIDIAMGGEVTVDIAFGETKRLALDSIAGLPAFAQEHIADFQTIDLTARENGTIEARLVKADGSVLEQTLYTSARDTAQATNVHVWEEMGLLLIVSAAIRQTPTGMQVNYFKVNRPDLLPAVKNLERLAEEGRLSPYEARMRTEKLMADNGLFPQDAENRELVRRLVSGFFD